jgi:hypothetical protein
VAIGLVVAILSIVIAGAVVVGGAAAVYVIFGYIFAG